MSHRVAQINRQRFVGRDHLIPCNRGRAEHCQIPGMGITFGLHPDQLGTNGPSQLFPVALPGATSAEPLAVVGHRDPIRWADQLGPDGFHHPRRCHSIGAPVDFIHARVEAGKHR